MDSDPKNTSVHRLTYNDKEIILIGTAHVSRESVDLVRQVILEEQPDTVCVELCESRYNALTRNDRWRDMDIVKVIREKKTFLLLSSLLLSSFQKKIGDKFNVRPGEEMITAMDTARETGAQIHLADREINVTLSRTWRAMSVSSRVKLLAQLLASLGGTEDIREEDIERLKNEDVLQSVLNEVGNSHPMIRKTLIDERDQYLCHKIRTAPGNKIVAVVGAGHVPGIRKYLNESIDIDDLDRKPPGGKVGPFLKWGIPLAILALIGWGFFMKGSHAGTAMIGWWIATHSVFAGIGAAIAFGRPLTILSAVIAAPITSLNPMIAAGWVSGLTEAYVSKPKVGDLEDLSGDILTVRGFWRNRVTRILLVVVFTNLGGAFGTFIALPMMLRVMG